MFKDFTEMPVWQKAMEIAVECFFLSERLPRKEDYGLTSQLRRSAESILAYIAEAFGRRSNKDKNRVYDISRSEAFETKNHLDLLMRVQSKYSLWIESQKQRPQIQPFFVSC